MTKSMTKKEVQDKFNSLRQEVADLYDKYAEIAGISGDITRKSGIQGDNLYIIIRHDRWYHTAIESVTKFFKRGIT